jgi:hypothetical protein
MLTILIKLKKQRQDGNRLMEDKDLKDAEE